MTERISNTPDSQVTYMAMYTGQNYRSNPKLVTEIQQAVVGILIPAVDAIGDADILESLDGYLYIEVSQYLNVLTTLQTLHDGHKPNTLGRVPGSQLVKMYSSVVNRTKQRIEIGRPHKVFSGTLRNLIVTPVLMNENGKATCVFPITGRDRIIHMDPQNLVKVEDPAQANPGIFLKNLPLEASKAGINRFIVVDGHYFLWRAMYGHSSMYTTKDRRFVGGAYGFYFTLLKFRQLYPEYRIHVCFDGNDKRKFAENPDYKATRKHPKSQAFWDAMNDNKKWCMDFVRACGFHLYYEHDKEGDDVVGSVAHCLDFSGADHTIIASKDTDFMSLVTNRIHHYVPKTNHRGSSIVYTPDLVCRHFGGLNSHTKVNWFRAIVGDSSDNIRPASASTGIPTNSNLARDLVNSSTNTEELLVKMLEEPSLSAHASSGSFDSNLTLLTINTSLFQGNSLKAYQNKFDEEKISLLLEHNAFWRELEQLSKNGLIIKGEWTS